ncbi:hypothetical protein FRC10_007985 [Ceratobasidium sp. 414]|nr:hypothetical protein FRC10_007985 [Ceratobasidium sp. 414]
MSQRPKWFDNALALFKSDSKKVRDAAAFAVGNMARRSPEQHLPVIVEQIQTDGKTRSLYMRAFKELMPSCSQASLGTVAESLWQPLLDIHSAHEDSVDITAVCLEKLAMTNPSQFLPLLEVHMQDPSPAVRALGVSTLQGLLGSETAGKDEEKGKELDERLIPLVLVLLAMLGDQDPNMKKLTLTALKQATSSKPHLIEDFVPVLLPKLYDETRSKSGVTSVANASLGEPGASCEGEDRLTAYEILCDIFGAFPSKLDLPGFLKVILRGLSDKSKDINKICLVTLYDLFRDAPTKVAQRLDDVVGPLRVLLEEAPVGGGKEKHHAGQTAELQKLALDASAAFSWALGLSYDGAPRFAAFAKELESGPWGPEFKEQRTKSRPIYVT